MKKRSKANGSNKDDWETPEWLLKEIEKEFGIFFDPCPLDFYYDGFEIGDWHDVNYINPPYSYPLKDKFIMKAFEQSKKGKLCIMLIPAATETKIFHNVIAPNAEVRLLKRRIKFKGYNTKGEYVTNSTGQSGSMLVIFGRDPKIIVYDYKMKKEVDYGKT